LSPSIGGFDRPQYLIVNFVYDLPFGQGKTWLNEATGSHILGRCKISGITTLAKGIPMVITGPKNTRLPGVSAAAVRLKDPVLPDNERTIYRWFDTTAFAPPPTYSPGNHSRTQPRLRTPGITPVLPVPDRCN
jgi:hypothetical protein